jgi:hypothetical protein
LLYNILFVALRAHVATQTAIVQGIVQVRAPRQELLNSKALNVELRAEIRIDVDAVADVTPPILSGVGYGGGCALAHAAC